MFFRLTHHLEKYNTGELAEIPCTIVNDPKKTKIMQEAPRYRANLGDLLNTRDELLRMKHSKIPSDKVTRWLLFSIIFIGIGLGVFSIIDYLLGFNVYIWAPMFGGSMGFLISAMAIIINHNFFPNPSSYIIDYQLKVIKEALNELAIEWVDFNGERK